MVAGPHHSACLSVLSGERRNKYEPINCLSVLSGTWSQTLSPAAQTLRLSIRRSTRTRSWSTTGDMLWRGSSFPVSVFPGSWVGWQREYIIDLFLLAQLGITWQCLGTFTLKSYGNQHCDCCCLFISVKMITIYFCGKVICWHSSYWDRRTWNWSRYSGACSLYFSYQIQSASSWSTSYSPVNSSLWTSQSTFYLTSFPGSFPSPRSSSPSRSTPPLESRWRDSSASPPTPRHAGSDLVETSSNFTFQFIFRQTPTLAGWFSPAW